MFYFTCDRSVMNVVLVVVEVVVVAAAAGGVTGFSKA